MGNIEENLKKILNSRFGKDVRQAIHDGIHDCYDDGKAGAIDLIARERIDNLAKLTEGSTTGDAELIDIRIGADGNVYDSAGEAVREQSSQLNKSVTGLSIELENVSAHIKIKQGNAYMDNSGSYMESESTVRIRTERFTARERSLSVKDDYKSIYCFSWCHWDSDGVLEYGNGSITDTELQMEAGTDYVIVLRKTDGSAIKPDEFYEVIDDNRSFYTTWQYAENSKKETLEIKKRATELSGYETEEVQFLNSGYRIDETGNLVQASGFWSSDFLPVFPGDKIVMTGYSGNANGTYPAIVATSKSQPMGTARVLLMPDGVTNYDNYELKIPSTDGIRWCRVCMREYQNSTPSVKIIKGNSIKQINLEYQKNSRNNIINDIPDVTFKHAESYCIEYPEECGQIGLCSVLDVRNIPVWDKVDGANLYMWAAPHDGTQESDFGASENMTNKGSIYLYTAKDPMGPWTLYSDTPVLSRADFARKVTAAEENAKYIKSGKNGDIIIINHCSSPDVVWDEKLVLEVGGKNYYGGFRIYFHAQGWRKTEDGSAYIQRTFLAYSHDGKTIDKYENLILDEPVIPEPTEIGAPDYVCSDYARVFQQGSMWYAIYNGEPLDASYNVAMTYSNDGGKTFFPTKRYLIHGRANGAFMKSGIPCVLLRRNALLVAYTANDPEREGMHSFGDCIRMAEVTEDGVVHHLGYLLRENSKDDTLNAATDTDADVWDSYRICAPFLLEYDNEIYLFYGGASKKNAQSSADRWNKSHIGVTKGELRKYGYE